MVNSDMLAKNTEQGAEARDAKTPEPPEPPQHGLQSGYTDWNSQFPGMLWSIEVPRSRLEIIKAWSHPALGEDTPLLLKDAAFRKAMVLPEDQLLFTEFWEAMTAFTPASALFRLNCNGRNWLFLQGWPGMDNSPFYHGFLQEANEHQVPNPKGNGGDLWALCRSVAGYPVFVLNPESKRVVGRNQEAVNMLGFDPLRRSISSLLLPGSMAANGRQAVAQASQDGQWGGALTFNSANGSSLISEARLTSELAGGRQLIRLIIRKTSHHTRGQEENRPLPGSVAESLLRQVAKTPSLRPALELLLASQKPQAFDGLFYSEIHADKGHVLIYGVGKHLQDLWEVKLPYEGTIAQNIERHGLEYLVVDNTRDSTKSIDWAFFVPRGIHSYFARPFYRKDKLKAVLVLCSQRPGAFSLSEVDAYEVLSPAFAKAVFRRNPKI